MTIKRIFIGIPIPASLAVTLCTLSQIHKDAKGINWVRVENLHITVCFIGNTEATRLNEIIGNIKTALIKAIPFTLTFEGLCLAPTKKPRMIWAKFMQNEYFTELAINTCRILVPGQPIRKDPIPHITLARFKKPYNSRDIDLNIQVKNNTIKVEEFVLWESIRKPKGVEYKRIEQFVI